MIDYRLLDTAWLPNLRKLWLAETMAMLAREEAEDDAEMEAQLTSNPHLRFEQ